MVDFSKSDEDIGIQKTMNSLHITSLYTNIHIKKCLNFLATHLRKIKFNSSPPINTLINICKHITYFKFDNKFYKQKSSPPVWNPLSSVLVCLFLEYGSFKYRIPINSTYFRYLDDILIFLSQNIKSEKIVEKLNNVEPSINFTYENQSNNTIPFLDNLIIKSQNDLTYKVCCKPTNKNVYIHFFSHHNNKIKTGLIIGFYLWALRICNLQYLVEEFKYIKHSLKSLKYPNFFYIKH